MPLMESVSMLPIVAVHLRQLRCVCGNRNRCYT